MTPESFLLLTARSPHPSMLLSTDGQILAANDPAASLIGRAAGSLQDVAVDDPAHLEDALRAWSAAGAAVGKPLRIATPDGRHHRFRGEGLRVMTADHEPVPRILLHWVPLDPPSRPGQAAGTGSGAEPGRVVGKMEAMGNLAAGIAHDFNNLLTVMKGEVELSQEHPGLPGMVVESLAATHDAIHQAEALVDGLLAFSRRQLVRVVTLDMRELVRGGLERVRPEIARPAVDVVLESSADPLPVTVDRAQMEAVLHALVRNASDAVKGSGRIRILTRKETVDAAFVRRNPGSTEGTFAVLEVTDDGVGIPPEIRARVFEPFFTTKGRGAGRGLGLAQAFGIVKALSGYLRVESSVGRGATFTVYLPLADASGSPRRDSARA